MGLKVKGGLSSEGPVIGARCGSGACDCERRAVVKVAAIRQIHAAYARGKLASRLAVELIGDILTDGRADG